MEGPFKRINFFKGLAAAAEDWQAAEAYHCEKRRLHNKYFHPPGVIFECLSGLAVTATRDGSAIRVEPGMALDEEGRELYLPDAVDLDVKLHAHKGETVYVTISYSENLKKEEHFRPNALNSDYAGYAFIEELPTVGITTDLPDNRRLELARIKLSPDAARVCPPKDPLAPAENEINRLFVTRTGKFRARLEDLADLVSGGEVDVSGSGAALIPIEDGQPSDEQRFYLTSVSAKELKSETKELARVHLNQGLHWDVLVRWKEENLINYLLEIRNTSPVDILAAYKIYRLR